MKKSNQAKALKRECGVDVISSMPDSILELILQGLPTTEEVVRTSVLSTRWRYLWTSIPYFPSLDIDCYRTAGIRSSMLPKEKFKDFVTWCLANKTIDLDSLRLCCASYYRVSTVKGWVKEAVNRNIKSLDLLFCHPFKKFSDFDFPEWLITCDSLEVLRLNFYRRTALNLDGCTDLRFRALRVLQLNKVFGVDVEAIEDLVGMSPLLEELTLIDCLILPPDPFRISSPMLKTLIIRKCRLYANQGSWCGVRVSCPELVSFEYVGLRDMLIFENINSLKNAVILPHGKMHRNITRRMGDEVCKVLAKISHVESLSVNLYFIQCIDAARDQKGNFPASFPNLKTLKVTTTTDAFTMNVIIRILKYSPNLESLYLVIQKEHLTTEYWTFDEAETSRIFTSHLKKVKFLEVNGKKRKLVIARCLLEHGNALEKMVFSWRSKVKYHEKSMKMMNKMSKIYKASSTVKLISVLKD